MSKTYFITDRQMLEHCCEWDKTHIEVPQRLEKIIDKLENSMILDQCNVLKSRMASEEDILLVHTPTYVNKIKKTQDQTTVCSFFVDFLYFFRKTTNISVVNMKTFI